MIPLRKRSVVVVCGVQGYGKTTLCLRGLVNGQFSARAMWDDMPGEFSAELGEFSDRLRLRPTRTGFDLSRDLMAGWIPFDPHHNFAGRLEEGLDFFCSWFYNKALALPGEKILVINDAYRFCTPHYIPEPLKTIVQSGSKRRLTLLVDAHEPQKLNGTFKAGMSEVICFRLQGDGPLAFAKEYGFDPDEVANLPRLHWIARNLDTGGELRGQIKI